MRGVRGRRWIPRLAPLPPTYSENTTWRKNTHELGEERGASRDQEPRSSGNRVQKILEEGVRVVDFG